MNEILQRLGLTKMEARIYLALIDLGKAQAGILSRKTGIHRRSVYDALDRLIEKGLVSYIQENEKRYYAAADPRRLQEIIELQQQEMSIILPALQAKFQEYKGRQETLFYRGVEGIKTVFEDQINQGKEVLIIGASRNARELLKFYLPHYTNKRIKKKIKLKAIYAGAVIREEVPFSTIRYLPESFASPVSTNVYGDTVAIMVWGPEPVAIVLQQTEIALAFRNYFEALWKMAKR